MDRLLRHVQVLAVDIGPRLSASPATARAAAYIRGVLEDCPALDVSTPELRAQRTFSWPIVAVLALAAAGTWVAYPLSPALGVLLVTAATGAFVAEALTIPLVSRLVPKYPARNVLGRLSAPGGRRRLAVVVAHLDSSRACSLFHPVVVPHFRAIFLALAAAMATNWLGLAGAWLIPGIRAGALVAARTASAYIVLCLGFLLERELCGQVSPGANDNASGVAVLLETARSLAQAPVPGLEVWFLATDAEESGTVGMSAFLDAHGEELRQAGAVIINLDNLGAGALAYITGEGMFGTRPSDPELLALAARVVAEEGLPVGPGSWTGLTTDAQAAMLRGFRALGIMAFDRTGNPPHWHWATDTAHNLEPDNLTHAHRLVVALLRAYGTSWADDRQKSQNQGGGH